MSISAPDARRLFAVAALVSSAAFVAACGTSSSGAAAPGQDRDDHRALLVEPNPADTQSVELGTGNTERAG